MAKRQITIDDGSKGRKQVALNLNPVALTPTVNSAGGNYRVAVQATPLTTSAMQLSKSLKQGVAAYGQAVEIGTKKGTEDAANMSDEDYDKFLQKGLDPEAKSLFGHTKAYNRKLSERYYATEIPTKLAALSSDMFKNYYDYKDPAAFEAALEARTGEVYAEADELLGGNVFGEQANNVLKAATRANFIGNEVEKFNRELPRRNQEMATETISRQIADVDETNIDSLFTIATKAFEGNVGILGKRAAAQAVFSSVQIRLETLIASDSSSDHDIADAIFDEIGGGKDEEKLVAGQELFATPERQLKLAELEKKLETRVEGSFRDAQQDAAVYSNAIQADLIGLDDEDKAKIVLDAKIKELHSSGSLDGEPLENGKAVDMLIIDLNKLKSNQYLFRQQHKANYIRQTSIQKEIMNDSVEAFLAADMAASGIYRVNTSVTRTPNPQMTDKGRELVAAYNLKSSQMYSALLESVSMIKDEEKRRMAYQKKETDELLPAMKEWFDKTTNAVINAPVTEAAQTRQDDVTNYLTEADRAKIAKSALNEDQTRELQDILIQKNKDEEAAQLAADVFQTAFTSKTPNTKVDADGNRLLKASNSGDVEGMRASYDKAVEEDVINGEAERIALHAQLRASYTGLTSVAEGGPKILRMGSSPQDRAYRDYKNNGPFWNKDDMFEIMEKKKKMVLNYHRYGVKISELVNDRAEYKSLSYERPDEKPTISEMFGGKYKVDFNVFPIIVNGSAEASMTIVRDYFLWKEKAIDTPFISGDYGKVAEVYGLSINELMTSQRTYFTTQKFITD